MVDGWRDIQVDSMWTFISFILCYELNFWLTDWVKGRENLLRNTLRERTIFSCIDIDYFSIALHSPTQEFK